jgi:hypothetical protein
MQENMFSTCSEVKSKCSQIVRNCLLLVEFCTISEVLFETHTHHLLQQFCVAWKHWCKAFFGMVDIPVVTLHFVNSCHKMLTSKPHFV